MLASLALLTLSLAGQGLQITIDDQPQAGLFTLSKKPGPLTVETQQSQFVVTPPGIIKDTDVYQLLTQLKLLQRVTGHYLLTAKAAQAVLPNKEGFVGLEGACSATPNGIKLMAGEDIPPYLFVHFNPFVPPIPKFLVIYQVSGLDHVNKDPSVFVGQSAGNPGDGSMGKMHQLKVGAYATLYDSAKWYGAVLAPKIESGAIYVSQVDVFTLGKP